jgi:mannose-6-phosphate isomerase-like protein (cupin superfamily)
LKGFDPQETDYLGMIFGMSSLAPGEETVHAHDEEELFYVLNGKGEAIWEVYGVTFRAELIPGVVFYKLSDIYHTMRNTGVEPLVGIAFKI